MARAARHADQESDVATILVSSVFSNHLNTKDRERGLKKGILRLPPGDDLIDLQRIVDEF